MHNLSNEQQQQQRHHQHHRRLQLQPQHQQEDLRGQIQRFRVLGRLSPVVSAQRGRDGVVRGQHAREGHQQPAERARKRATAQPVSQVAEEERREEFKLLHHQATTSTTTTTAATATTTTATAKKRVEQHHAQQQQRFERRRRHIRTKFSGPVVVFKVSGRVELSAHVI